MSTVLTITTSQENMSLSCGMFDAALTQNPLCCHLENLSGAVWGSSIMLKDTSIICGSEQTCLSFRLLQQHHTLSGSYAVAACVNKTSTAVHSLTHGKIQLKLISQCILTLMYSTMNYLPVHIYVRVSMSDYDLLSWSVRYCHEPKGILKIVKHRHSARSRHPYKFLFRLWNTDAMTADTATGGS